MRLEIAVLYLLVLLKLLQSVISEHIESHFLLDLMHHVDWNQTSATMTPIPGSNGQSTAYYLGPHRNLFLPSQTMHTFISLLEDNQDFSILAAVKQQEKNVGSIISLSSHNKKYLELESSGRRDEIRLHYMHKGKAHTETFPYRLADNQWHNVALSITADFVQLFIDCQKIYERNIQVVDRHFTRREISDMTIWLGQRNNRHAYFKGAIEYVKFIARAQGYLEQCPHANIDCWGFRLGLHIADFWVPDCDPTALRSKNSITACPTCSQFRQLQDAVKDLNSLVDTLNKKLIMAESRISELEKCDCMRSCDVNGTHLRDGQAIQKDSCTTCTCHNGEVTCERKGCPRVDCLNPVTLPGECCPVCLSLDSLFQEFIVRENSSSVTEGGYCYKNKKYYQHGESYSPKNCMTCTCQDGRITCTKQEVSKCPKLECSRSERISVQGECCQVCRNTDFCGTQATDCHVNATCNNRKTGYWCQCKAGYTGDGKHCEDWDECQYRGDRDSRGGHHCHTNTKCVNVPGSYECECLEGFVRRDRFTCEDHDECSTGAHQCHENAHCINEYGSYKCQCKEGYEGDGFQCEPKCIEPCKNDGQCVSPAKCLCRKGYMGRSCELDMDECELGVAKCHSNSICVNMPGSYMCKCKKGFYSDHADNHFGSLCHDINECEGWNGGDQCPSGTVCTNTQGGYECVCLDKANCQEGCSYNGRMYGNGQNWRSYNDVCSVCKCKKGIVHCKRKKCNCKSKHVNLQCCPHCEERKQCVHQELPIVYYSGDTWNYQCQTCECLNGTIDCWKLECPILSCAKTVQLEGDCCPRCYEDDPCRTDFDFSSPGSLVSTKLQDQLCYFNGRTFYPGRKWMISWDTCTSCECKYGHVCCSYDQMCSQRMSRRHKRATPEDFGYNLLEYLESNDETTKDTNKRGNG